MIGIFDSGSGGLSVLKALRDRAPRADVLYFGDLKNAPYGGKTREELGALTVLGIEKLIHEGATEIVSACNSVSVSIVLPMFDILELPRTSIIEMVGPTVASFKGSGARVLVLATRATVESGVYRESFRMVGVEAQCVAVPDLVPLIEAGAGKEAVRAEIDAAVRPHASSEFTHVVLGCTHFPLVRGVFEEVMRACDLHASVFDPADAVADVVCAQFDTAGSGVTRIIISKESAVFRRLADMVAPGNTCRVVERTS